MKRKKLASMSTRELETLLKRVSAIDVDDLRRIPIAEQREGLYPMSSHQERIWFMCQYDDHANSSYNVPILLKLSGHINLEYLEASINEIIRRHEALRTSFLFDNGELWQKVHTARPIQLKVHKTYEGVSFNLENENIHECINMPFNLEEDPLVRADAFCVKDDVYLLIVIHHIAVDGWSINLLLREILMIYDNMVMGEQKALPELRAQYVDYALWLEKWTKSNVYQSHKEYWVNKFAGRKLESTLRLDYSRPQELTFHSSHYLVRIDKETLVRLKLWSIEREATVFVTLMAAFSAAVRDTIAQEHVAIGSPVANRMFTEFENTVGCFTNNIVVFPKLTGNESIDELVSIYRDELFEAYERQEIPFDHIVDALNIERVSNIHPIFQVMFNYQNMDNILESNFMKVKQIPIHSRSTKFDIHANFVEHNDTLTGWISYNANIFKPSTIRRFVNHFFNILMFISSANKSGCNFRLELPKKMNYDQTVIEKFEDCASLHPDKPALKYGTNVLTYGELNRRANQLARYLIENVPTPGRIGIYMDSSVEMVISIIAAMKLGIAYIPLDPDMNLNRFKTIRVKAELSSILTTGNNWANWEDINITLIVLDEIEEKLVFIDGGNLLHTPDMDDEAYIIFTSGSTGESKGVIIGHAQLQKYVFEVTQRLKLNECNQFAMLTSFYSDLGLTMFYPALCSGACIHVLSKEMVIDVEQFATYLQHNQIDCYKIVPSHFKALSYRFDPVKLLPRKKLIFGGETLEWELIERIGPTHGCELYNHYGPAECTVGIMTYSISLERRGKTVPIGYPFNGIKVLILDENQNPVGKGEIGELLVAGDQLARGYIGDPSKTEKVFIDHPELAERWYITGDLVRELDDGSLEFMGRKDHVVKISGYLIDMSDIERVINQCPYVLSSSVVMDGTYLSACIQFDETKGKGIADLKQYLEEQLPTHMIPDRFYSVDTIPLNKTGKIDRHGVLSLLKKIKRRIPNKLMIRILWWKYGKNISGHLRLQMIISFELGGIL